MARTQNVSIPLDEYRALLLKGVPDDKGKWLLDTLIETLRGGITYTDGEESRWSSTVVGRHMEVLDPHKLVKELLNVIRVIDRELYMSIFNGVMTDERERRANEERIRHMNEAKELRGELEGE